MTYLPYLTLNIITEFYLHRNIHCRREDCGCCNQLKGSQKVISYQTKFTVEIPCILACYSTCVIYLLECKHCFKQYVGETNSSLRSRMKRHRNMSTQATRRPLYSPIKNALQLPTPYPSSNRLKTPLKEKLEAWYIQQSKTKIPFGFNVINNS